MKTELVTPEQAELMRQFQEDMQIVDPDKGPDAYSISKRLPDRFQYEYANFLFSVWLKGLERNKPC